MKTICITGSNRGIGLGLVKYYLQSGDKVIAMCRNPVRATELKALSSSGNLSVIGMDIGDKQSIQQAVNQIGDCAIDVLINNAGVGGDGGQSQSLEQINEDDWLQVLRINTLAPFFVTRALLPSLRQSPAAKVMMLSSQLSVVSYNNIGLYAYESSKTALNKVVRGLSVDLEPEGICVCALDPGWVKTDMGGPNAEITVEQATNGLAKIIDGLDLSKTGTFWQWNGKEQSW